MCKQENCSVGCQNFRVELRLDGAANPEKAIQSFPRRDRLAGLCRVNGQEVIGMDGLTPTGKPKDFRSSVGNGMLDDVANQPCLFPADRVVTMNQRQIFWAVTEPTNTLPIITVKT